MSDVSPEPEARIDPAGPGGFGPPTGAMPAGWPPLTPPLTPPLAPQPLREPGQGRQTALGLALVLPAFVLLIVSYGWPAAWTVRSGFQRISLLRSGASVGGFTSANYAAAFKAHLGADFGYALSLAVVPILIVLVAAPVLAWAAHRGGTGARWVTRGLLALPLAAYAPTAIAVALFVSPDNERSAAQDLGGFVRSVYWWGTFGLVTALAATLFLATLRRRDPRRSPWPALAVAAGIAVAGTVAAALQEFTYPAVIGGENERAATPATDIYRAGFLHFDFGRGAAVSTLLLAALVALGLAVTLVIVLSGLRLEFDDGRRSADEPAGWPTSRIVGVVVAAIVLVIVVTLTLIGIGPLLGRIFGGGGSAPQRVSNGTVALNTWAPPLLSSLVGVAAAALAAFGIGWLRPLGRRSEWLLLPFGLFLFVGVVPLGLRGFVSDQSAGRLDTFTSLVPPSWIAVPALFVLTLLLRGQALRAEALRAEQRPPSVAPQLVPVLPMFALVFLVTWVAQAQDLFWPLISASSPAHQTGPVTVLESISTLITRPDAIPFGLALPAVALVVFVLLAIAAQLLYLDRVALRVGRPEHDAPPLSTSDRPAAALPPW